MFWLCGCWWVGFWCVFLGSCCIFCYCVLVWYWFVYLDNLVCFGCCCYWVVYWFFCSLGIGSMFSLDWFVLVFFCRFWCVWVFSWGYWCCCNRLLGFGLCRLIVGILLYWYGGCVWIVLWCCLVLICFLVGCWCGCVCFSGW